MRRASLLAVLFLCPLALISGCGGGSAPKTTTPLNPSPAIQALSPASVQAGSAAQTLTVTGSGFVQGSVASLNGTALQTTFVSSTTLQAAVPANALAAGAVTSITVSNPSPGGGASSQAEFDVTSPTPAVSGVSPSTLPQGKAAVVTVAGTGFEANSTALWNGSSRPTTVLSPTSLQVSLTAADVQNFGTGQITVNNPGPGGSTTPATVLPVLAPLSATTLAPASVAAGSPAQTLTVTGTGFLAGSIVSVDGTAQPTTFVSSTSLQIALTAALEANSRTASVAVSNPAGTANAGTTPPLSLPVTAVTPTIASLAPASVGIGQAATITLTGSGFEANSVAQWNGAARPTTFTSGTTLQIALSAADLAAAGNGQVSVANPGPGGGTSASVSLTVAGVPVIRSLSPTVITAGSGPQTLTLTGTGFLSNSIVLADGTSLQTTFVSPTSLTAIVPASVLATQHAASITVSNPGTPPQTSAPATLAIGSDTPVITSINPDYLVVNEPEVILDVIGTGFTDGTSAYWNGRNVGSGPVSSTHLQVFLNRQDLQAAGTGQLVLTNFSSSGSSISSSPFSLTVVDPPNITNFSPDQLLVDPSATQPVPFTLIGTNFDPKATVSFDGGASVPITSHSATQIVVSLPATFLTKAGNHYITVFNPPPDGSSNLVSSLNVDLPIIDPTAPFGITPANAPAGSGALTLTISGKGFLPDTQVLWNGTPLPVTYTDSSFLSASVPASLLANVGVASVTLNTPEHKSQQPAPRNFTTYLSLPTNDIAWNSRDGLIYATVAGTAGPGLGNNLVGIDPATGVIQRRIFVGSEPNRLAISTDGTTAFVGLNGAGAVREVDLVAGTAGLQFSLTGSNLLFIDPSLVTYVANDLAVLPGQSHSVAVLSSDNVVRIFDSGVARPKTSKDTQIGLDPTLGGLAFGSSASTLYSSSYIAPYLYRFTVDAAGISASTTLSTTGLGKTLQYDNGRLYFPNGTIADPDSGATLGQFSNPLSEGPTAYPAAGPVRSDATLNTAWVVLGGSNGVTVQAYDETTLNPRAGQSVSQLNDKTYAEINDPADLIRWGQSGLAFHTSTSLYIMQGAVVKAPSSVTSDLQVQAAVSPNSITGVPLSFHFNVKNGGSSDAQGVTVQIAMPGTLTANSGSASQGTCTGNGIFYCELGTLASGATATITVSGTPTQAGTVQADALVSAQTTDNDPTNNLVSASSSVTGALFSPVPLLASISPNIVQSGSSDTTITVLGSGFTSASTVTWDGTALPTTLISAGKLMAQLDAARLATFGSAQIAVNSAAPGGGTSNTATLTLYRLLDLPATAMLWDRYTRHLYVTLPSTVTNYTGNSLVSIDPATGTVGNPIVVGSEPNLLAETTSGNHLYIGLSGASSVGRFNILTQTLDATAHLTQTTYPYGPTTARRLVSLPGLDSTVAAVGVGILDFAGTTATVRPTSDTTFVDTIFPDTSHVYTLSPFSQETFYRSTVDENGVHPVDGTYLIGMDGPVGNLSFDGGLIYGAYGGIANPTTTIPSMLGVLPIGSGLPNDRLLGQGVVPYAAEAKSFNVSENIAGTEYDLLERFDTNSFTLEERVTLPANFDAPPLEGTRWGQDGLAFILPAGLDDNTSTKILLLRGAFVLPSETTSHPAPSLTAAGTGSLPANSGNQLLTVTGTGFLPGATVFWNSTAQDTTFVDAQHLTVAVGATQVKAAGSITLTCQNPGSSASNAVQLTIQ